jgi:hypothetical protein
MGNLLKHNIISEIEGGNEVSVTEVKGNNV